MLIQLTHTPKRVKDRPPALLAVVILGGPQSRAEVAELLWPDSPHARSNLRVELHRLERGPYAGSLHISPTHLSPSEEAVVDMKVARQYAAQGQTEEALAAATAELLPWLEDAAPELDEWLQAQRAAWSAFYQGLLRQAAHQAEEQGELQRAREHLKTLSSLDPLSEEAWRQWLRLCVLLRDEPEAKRVYAGCQAMTRREFGREPGVATKAWLEQLQQPESRGASTSGLPRLPLVGRSELLRDLQRAATCTLLLGDPGVGKSRLALEFARQFKRALVVSGLVSGAPLGAIAFTLDEAGEVAYSAPARSALETLRGAAPDQEFTPTRREELHAGLAAALLEAAGPHGCLVIDDLHLLDHASLEVLRGVLHAAQQLPAGKRPALVATARAFELEQSQAGGWVRQERAGGYLRSQDVPPLSGADLLALVQHLSDGAGGSQFASVLQDATGGNPLFFLETLRSLMGSGHVRVDELGRWHVDFQASGGYAYLPLPRSVAEAVLGRAELLPGEARRVLDMLSIQTLPLSAPVLAQACALSEWQVLEAARTLHKAGFIHEVSSGFTLRHDLQRQALRSSLPPQHLGVLHAGLAGALATAGASAQEVAQCFESGGRGQEAAQWWLRAAEQSKRAFAPPEALAAYERALSLGLGSLQALTTHFAIFDLQSVLGHDHLARQQLPLMRLLLAEHPELRAEYEVREALIHLRDAAYPAVLALTEHVLASSTDPQMRARALHVQGMARVRLAQFAEAEADLQESRRLESGDLTLRAAEVGRALVQIALMRRDLERARSEAQELQRITELLGDPAQSAQTEAICGTLGAMSGDFESARQHYQRCMAIADQHGLTTLAAQARSNLAGLILQEGRTSEALALYQNALPHLPATAQPVVQANMALIQFQFGQLELAFNALQTALNTAQARGEVAIALRRKTALLELKLRCGVWLEDEVFEALLGEGQRLGSDDLKHYLHSLRLHAAILRGDDLSPFEARLRALNPNPSDERERHLWTLAWAALQCRDLAQIKADLQDSPPSDRLATLSFLAGLSAAPELSEHAWLTDKLILAHAKAQRGDEQAEQERESLLSELKANWPEHQGNLERLLDRLKPIPA